MKKILTFSSFLFLYSCSIYPTFNEIPSLSENLSSLSEAFSPGGYKKDVIQGSVLREEKFNSVKLGMTKKEIVSIIGSPSISDPFHANQWEYIHYSVLKDDQVLSYRITLFFDENVLKDIKKQNSDKINLVEEKNFNFSPEMNNKDEKISEADPWFKFW